MLHSLELGFPGAETLQPTWLHPPACLKSACLQAWPLDSRGGSTPASLRGPPSTGGSVSPGCLPWTHADSAGPAPGWCQLQGRCWSRQLSVGLPLDCGSKPGGRTQAGRRGDHCQGWVGWGWGGPARPPTQPPSALAGSGPLSPCLCFSWLLSKFSQGCHTKSALWGSAAARARSLSGGISAWNREPTLIRLPGWKGLGVRLTLGVGWGDLVSSLGMGEDAEGGWQRLSMTRPQASIREAGFCEDSLASGT